jgi:hypothetical protein
MRPCKNCGNVREDHFTDKWIDWPFWCIKNGRDVYDMLDRYHLERKRPMQIGQSLTDDISFREMNNLEYLEWKSK